MIFTKKKCFSFLIFVSLFLNSVQIFPMFSICRKKKIEKQEESVQNQDPNADSSSDTVITIDETDIIETTSNSDTSASKNNRSNNKKKKEKCLLILKTCNKISKSIFAVSGYVLALVVIISYVTHKHDCNCNCPNIIPNNSTTNGTTINYIIGELN